MPLSKRQSYRSMAVIGSEYVDRMFKSPQNNDSCESTKASTRSKSGEKCSKAAKEYAQAYEWSQRELMSPGNKSTKTKATASSVRKTKPPFAPATQGSLPSSLRRLAQQEPLSPASMASDKVQTSAPSEQFCERSFEPPPIIAPRYQRVRKPISRCMENSKREAPRRSTLSTVVTILLAIIFIAICDHVSHLLMRTNILSDLGLQFLVLFLKATFQVLIVMFILAKVHRDGYIQRSFDRRCGFRDFMHSQEGKMIEAHKLRAWFGDTAVFDPQYLTKWTDENRREFWQCRPTHGTY